MPNEILIVSEDLDKSTDKVLEWIFHYDRIAKRINVHSDSANFNIIVSNNSNTTNLDNKIIWYRRGYFPSIPAVLKKSKWINYLKQEQLPALFAFENMNKKNSIGSYGKEVNNNKILNLKYAAEAGLKIPNTIVTNNKRDLLKFVEKNKSYITKSLNRIPYLEFGKKVYYGSGTNELDISLISSDFALSLIQEYVEKEVEIRIFFIDDNFYSMAIFSQSDELTRLDFRNYNNEKPNRNIPFLLPKKILHKLKLFLEKIDCNTGSIDLILTPDGEYVFLEINPMGQYDWLSENCNFYIDKKIAEILIEKSENG